jgi:hypothetical protein
MRRFLYTFYNLLASYLVIFFLLAGSFFLIYLGTGYRPIEASYEALLEKRVELKRERQRLAEELDGMRQGDLRKRLEIFSEQFIVKSEVNQVDLLKILRTNYNASGWRLGNVTIAEQEMPDNELGLGLVAAVYKGRSLGTNLSDGSLFLPMHSLLQASSYSWRKPPIKDFYQIRVERDADGYLATLGVIYPLAKEQAMEVIK